MESMEKFLMDIGWFDFGGGTFDAMVKIARNMQVVDTEGDNHLGLRP